MFSQKWVFDKMGFSRILEISRRVLDFSKMGFRRNGFFFWASRINTQKWFIFTRDFLAIFPNLCFLWKCCSKMGFSQEFSTRAQILKNGFSKKWVFLSAFWERKLEKWLTIFARTYCTVIKVIFLWYQEVSSYLSPPFRPLRSESKGGDR